MGGDLTPPRPAGPDLAHLERLLGDFEIEGKLARTSRAAIYRVRLGARGTRPLALKVALEPSATDDLARFQHEARLLSEIRHPGVVEVYEVGVLPGDYPFLVMELVSPYVPSPEPDWEEIYDLAIQAAAGLAHIHHHRVVHLDVKPSNLGLAEDPGGGGSGGRLLRILDFGLAQGLVEPLDRRIRGTLAYTAPEVLLQDAYDHRADLYSLGLTLLELATGTLPSAGSDREAILFHLSGEVPDPRRLRPGFPEPLAAILERLLQKDPRDRYPSAARLLEELGRAAGRPIAPGELALGPGGVLASRLVGREAALERLLSELAAARGGAARTLWVEGPAGVGKSRLLREFRLLAAVQGARVGFGRAEVERSRPLAPVLVALAQLGIDLEPPAAGAPAGPRNTLHLTDEQERFRLYREVSRRLAERAGEDAGEGKPLVLVLEDLHLAGREASELASFLAVDLGPVPVLVVASRAPAPDTPAETAGASALAPVLALEPLDFEAVGRLVDASLGVEHAGSLPRGFYDWIHEASAGRPGPVQQLLRHLIDEDALVFRSGEWKPRRSALARLAAPPGAEALDRQRLAALAPREVRLLEAAAVFGRPFRLATLARLLGEGAESLFPSLSGLLEEGFLERFEEPGRGEVYAVAGERLRDGVYAALESARRVELHGALAGLLGERHAAGEPGLAAPLAEHLWRAGRRAEALPCLLEAAEHAGALHAHAEAASLLGRAAEAAREAGDPGAAARSRVAQAHALARSDQPGRALRSFGRLLESGDWRGAGGPEVLGRLCLEKGRLHGRLGEHPEALAAFSVGLEALAGPAAEGDEPELALELLHGRATALRDLGQTGAAFETVRDALARARRSGLARQRIFLANALAMLHFGQGDWRRAGRYARAGLAAAGRVADPALSILLRNSLAMVLWKTGDYDGASRLFEANLAEADALADPWAQLAALNNLGILACSRGEWERARGLLTRSLEMNRRLGSRDGEALARINLGEVEEILGDWRRARRHARRALALLDGPEAQADRVAALVLLASISREEGLLDEAGDLLDQAAAGAEAAGDRDLATQALFQRGFLAARRGQPERAAADLEEALERARRAETRDLEAKILVQAAAVDLDLGDPGRAGERAREARRRVDELGDRLTSGRLLEVEARLAGAGPGEGARAAADRLFARSVELLDQVGARSAAARSLAAWGASTASPEAARERLSRALETFEALGAALDAERAREALARLRGPAGAPAGGEVTLHEVMKVINSSLDLQEVLDRTMDLALERLGAQRGMIVLADPLTRELEVAVARNLGREDRAEEHKLSESVVRRVIDQNAPILAVDAVTDSRFAGAESIVASHILSILCVPLAIRERLAGAIYVDHTESRHLFSDADRAFLEAFADGAAVAVDNARLYGELDDARRRLKAENESLKREILSSHHLGGLIGKSRAILELRAMLERVAQSSSTVLIRGESGTGKGLVARIIHNISPRREGPFIHFNCAALPETLVESELFGHEKGAFTGATERKPGRFELAHEGTIFLDEIGKVSHAVQAKLLRVVEDKQFERVGGTRTQHSDVRIITATNLNLEEAISRDQFREDLYYRLNIIPIILPPLRERREDVPYLVQHFLRRISRDLGQETRRLDPAVLELFDRHPWPGNVRELEAAIHRALVLSSRDVLAREDFAWIAPDGGGREAAARGTGSGSAAPELVELDDGGYQRAVEAHDRKLLSVALGRCDGKIRETARLLGIARNTLKAKMKKYGLEGP